MKTKIDKTKESQNVITPSVASESSTGGTAQLMDNRTSTINQRKLGSEINNTNKSENPIQRKNNTGLPDNLKSGIENLSGYSMDDVKVHYNSSKPAQLQAHAYAQGTDIHLAPGQEKHLPHEAWHVVQQKQGRVKPTMQFKGKVNINDDVGLEKEADVMGSKACQLSSIISDRVSSAKPMVNTVIQREYDKDVVKDLLKDENKKALLFGLAPLRGKTHNRYKEAQTNKNKAIDKKTIDEYNDEVGINNMMTNTGSGEGIFRVRKALNEPSKWKTYLPNSKEDYFDGTNSEETEFNNHFFPELVPVANNVQKWMNFLVDQKERIGLFDLGRSEVKVTNRIIQNLSSEIAPFPAIWQIKNWLSADNFVDANNRFENTVENDNNYEIRNKISNWIYKCFFRRTSKLGIDFATSKRGLNSKVYFNLAGANQQNQGPKKNGTGKRGNNVFAKLANLIKGNKGIEISDPTSRFPSARLDGLADMADNNPEDLNRYKSITESEYLHAKKLIEEDPTLADKILFYNEL